MSVLPQTLLTDQCLALNFECQRCGECCRQEGFVYLKAGEAQKIADFFGLDVYDFTERYCELLNRQKLVLKKAEKKEDCIFLEGDRCRVQPVKPEQCRDFPIGWRTVKSLDYCAGIKRILKEKKDRAR